jgi:hypothetical protein
LETYFKNVDEKEIITDIKEKGFMQLNIPEPVVL